MCFFVYYLILLFTSYSNLEATHECPFFAMTNLCSHICHQPFLSSLKSILLETIATVWKNRFDNFNEFLMKKFSFCMCRLSQDLTRDWYRKRASSRQRCFAWIFQFTRYYTVFDVYFSLSHLECLQIYLFYIMRLYSWADV